MLVEKLGIFFRDFGETCQLAGVDVTALFNEQSSEFSGIGGNRPSALVLASVNPQRRQSFVRGGVAYSIAGMESDGLGFVLLDLERA